MLNQASKIIDKVKISAGGLSATAVDVRCILREALVKRASAIVLCHNHPSGNIRPSKEDDLLTRHVAQASECMDIRLVDHIILTDGAFYSYSDEGRI
jgi:DNA repair protein RadC